MEPEHETQRQTYQLCRLGFGILSLSLLIASVAEVMNLINLFGMSTFVSWVVNLWWWRWTGTPIVWGCLVGTYLLWARWDDLGWQRRVGLLILMSLVDVILWALNHGDDLGHQVGDVGHQWLRNNLGQALGWAEFALLASLAGDVMAHLGVEKAREASRSTRSLAATGAVVWMLLFCQLTIWRRWPLQGHRIDRSLETLLLFLGSTMIWTITLIQVTALAFAATRETSRALAALDLEERNDDLFRSPSEANADVLPNLYGPGPRDSRDPENHHHH